MSGRVFITGALGFIGRALADRYRTLGWEISGVDVKEDAGRGVVAGDVTREGPWQRHVAGATLVVHTAAVVSNAVPYARTWEVNVLGTKRVVDAAHDARVERLVHFSSIRAFSDRGYPEGVDESWPVRPDGSAYVDTKIASEHVVLQAHAAGRVAATVIRPGDVYGPGSRPWVVLPLEAIQAGRFALPAGGRGAFSPVYVENLIDGVLLAAGSAAAAGEIFTITDGATITAAEFFSHHHRWLGRGTPRSLPTPLAVAAAGVNAAACRLRGIETEVNPESVRYLARTGGYSIAKARRVLGYEPQVGLEEGMRRTEEWARKHGLLDPSLRTDA